MVYKYDCNFQHYSASLNEGNPPLKIRSLQYSITTRDHTQEGCAVTSITNYIIKITFKKYHLFICITKSFKNHIIFWFSGLLEMRTNAADCTRCHGHPYFYSERAPAPPYQLPEGYMPTFCVFGSLICRRAILLFVL